MGFGKFQLPINGRSSTDGAASYVLSSADVIFLRVSPTKSKYGLKSMKMSFLPSETMEIWSAALLEEEKLLR